MNKVNKYPKQHEMIKKGAEKKRETKARDVPALPILLYARKKKKIPRNGIHEAKTAASINLKLRISPLGTGRERRNCASLLLNDSP